MLSRLDKVLLFSEIFLVLLEQKAPQDEVYRHHALRLQSRGRELANGQGLRILYRPEGIDEMVTDESAAEELDKIIEELEELLELIHSHQPTHAGIPVSLPGTNLHREANHG